MLVATTESSDELLLTILMRHSPAGHGTSGAQPAAGPRQYAIVLGKVSGTAAPVLAMMNPLLRSTMSPSESGITVMLGTDESFDMTVYAVSAGWERSPGLSMRTESPSANQSSSAAEVTARAKGAADEIATVRSASILHAAPPAAAVFMVSVSLAPGPAPSFADARGTCPSVSINPAILRSFKMLCIASRRFCCTSATSAST